jgi:hypothetical protein
MQKSNVGAICFFFIHSLVWLSALSLAAKLIDVLRIENAALAKCEEAMRAADALSIQNSMCFEFWTFCCRFHFLKPE